MKNRPIFSPWFIACVLACTPILSAQTPAPTPTPAPAPEEQTPASDTSGPNRFWQATIGEGHYMVALDRISSISHHQYVLDGTLIVDEVTVDSLGQALARFYYIAPITDAASGNTAANIARRGTELLNRAAERAGTDVQNMVVKKYPETTHARTVEFRLLSKEELTTLYQSLRNSWESGRGRRFTAR